MHRLETKHFVLTLTTFVSIIYIICAALTLAAPGAVLALANQWAHAINVETIASSTPPTAFGLAAGFVTAAITTAILAWVFVFHWNMFAKQEVKK